jgi:hypothetical protein
MKRKADFKIITTITVIFFLVSWIIIQIFAIETVERKAILSIINLAVHGVGMWFVLKLFASLLKK